MLEKIEIVTPFLLKIAIVLLALPMFMYVLYGGYIIIDGLFRGVTAWYIYPPFIIMWFACIPYFLGLTQAFHLVVLFDRGQFFSHITIERLTTLFKHSVIIGTAFLVALPFWYMIAETDDSPGLLLVILLIIGLSYTIALINVLLRQVVNEGLSYKENS